MINNIEKKDDLFNVGYIESKMFNKKIEVWIKNTVDVDYAQKCAENFESLKDDVIDKICERVYAYYKFMMDIWDDELVAEINEKIPCDVSEKEILSYVENPKIFILPPKGNGIGYKIEGWCDWEPEHGIDIIMLDDKVMDVGPQDELSPWTNWDELERLF